MSSCNRLSQAFCTCYRNSAMVVAGSGERLSTRSIMYHKCSIGERFGDLAGQAVVHYEKQVASQKPYVGVRCPVEKAHQFPVEEMTVARG